MMLDDFYCPSSFPALNEWALIQLRCNSSIGGAILYGLVDIRSTNSALFSSDSWLLYMLGPSKMFSLGSSGTFIIRSVHFLYVQLLLLIFTRKCLLLVSFLSWRFALFAAAVCCSNLGFMNLLPDSPTVPSVSAPVCAQSIIMLHSIGFWYCKFSSARWFLVLEAAAKCLKTLLDCSTWDSLDWGWLKLEWLSPERDFVAKRMFVLDRPWEGFA